MRYVKSWTALDSGLSQKPWFAPRAATTVVTYSFHTERNLPAPSELFYGSDRTKVLTGHQQDLVRGAMDRFEALGNLVFVETARDAAINILGVEGSDWGGWSSYPTYRGTLVLESMSMGTILHEIGHSLGFKHPFEDEVRLRPELDTKDMTIMSYTGFSDMLGPLDEVALRKFYGRPGQTEEWEIESQGRRVVILGGRDEDSILGAWTRNELHGKGGDDRLFGHTERDRLHGGAGDDRLKGMEGRDVLSGGKGDDTLFGMSGNDRLTGGRGEDLFVFRQGEGTDRITDFKPGADRIEIRNGASEIDDLSMRQRGEDVVIRFGDGPYWKTRIIVEDSTLEEMRQEDVFLF